MTTLDAERWTGPPAPEGSPDRIEARRRLWAMARRASRVYEQPAGEWIDGVRRTAPQLVAASGDNVERATLVAWGGLGR